MKKIRPHICDSGVGLPAYSVRDGSASGPGDESSTCAKASWSGRKVSVALSVPQARRSRPMKEKSERRFLTSELVRMRNMMAHRY
jgi:hypothetical protein